MAKFDKNVQLLKYFRLRNKDTRSTWHNKSTPNHKRLRTHVCPRLLDKVCWTSNITVRVAPASGQVANHWPYIARYLLSPSNPSDTPPAISKGDICEKHNSKPATATKPSRKHVHREIPQLPTPPSSESESSPMARESSTENSPTSQTSRQSRTPWNPAFNDSSILDEPISLSCISLSTCQAMHLHHCALSRLKYLP